MKANGLKFFSMMALLCALPILAAEFTMDTARGDGEISWRGTPVIKTFFGIGSDNLLAGECERREIGRAHV